MDDVWTMEGELDDVGFEGYADDRFPLELAVRVLSEFSAPGDRVLDPFAGLGTTLAAAGRLGRLSVGIESDPVRAEYLRQTFKAPHRVIESRIQDVDLQSLPLFDLVFCSPPYPMVNLHEDPWGPTYFQDMRTIFSELAKRVVSGGRIVVEVSNVSTDDGFRPLVSQFEQTLSSVLPIVGQIIRLNRADVPAGPGVRWSALLIYSPAP